MKTRIIIGLVLFIIGLCALAYIIYDMWTEYWFNKFMLEIALAPLAALTGDDYTTKLFSIDDFLIQYFNGYGYWGDLLFYPDISQILDTIVNQSILCFGLAFTIAGALLKFKK